MLWSALSSLYLKQASRTHSAHTSRIPQKLVAESLAPHWTPDTTGSLTKNEPGPDILCCHTVYKHTHKSDKWSKASKMQVKEPGEVLPGCWAGTPGSDPHTNCTLDSWGISFHLELQHILCPVRQKHTHLDIHYRSKVWDQYDFSEFIKVWYSRHLQCYKIFVSNKCHSFIIESWKNPCVVLHKNIRILIHMKCLRTRIL